MEMILSFLERNRLGRKMFKEGIMGRNKKFGSGYLIFKIFVKHLNRTAWLIRGHMDVEYERKC